jgi:single-strand DNA-binding protein
MGIANTRHYKGSDGQKKEETLFVNVIAWRGTAEFCGEHMKKGHAVIVEGRLKSDDWEDKTTGQKRSRIEVQADRVHQTEWHGSVAKTAPTTDTIPEDDIPF